MDYRPPCDSRVVESGIRGAVYGALWSAMECLHHTSREHAGYADGANLRQIARLAPDNGVQCVALRTSAQPVAAAWAGGGAAGLAATASVRNTRFALACSLTCATAAAGVELLRGGNE